MISVEKQLTDRNVDLMRSNPEFILRNEGERTLVAVEPRSVEQFREFTHERDSTYLSHPERDEFSLRVQAVHYPEGTQYKAVLKDRGWTDDNGILNRMEVPVDISKETYEMYANNPLFPNLHFDRVDPVPNLSIDFIEGVELPQVEYETQPGEPEDPLFTELKPSLEDRSSDPSVRKEAIAYRLHKGEVYSPSSEKLDDFTTRVYKNMVAQYTLGTNQVVVGISGMSGSGKSSVVEGIRKALVEDFGEEFAPVVVSSDDYHRGKKWLEANYGAPWKNWDAPIVYDTEELARDIIRLRNGESIMKRHFDFEKEEVVYDKVLEPSPFVIVEGLFAGSPDLKQVRQLYFELPTGIATCIGRDVRRLIIEDRANIEFPDPESRLRYQVEVAYPTYLAQERPKGNSFSAHSRPMAERAFMLERLNA